MASRMNLAGSSPQRRGGALHWPDAAPGKGAKARRSGPACPGRQVRARYRASRGCLRGKKPADRRQAERALAMRRAGRHSEPPRSASAAASPCAPGPGNPPAPAGCPCAHAMEGCGKAALLHSLAEEAGTVSAPRRTAFRAGQKRPDAAFEGLPAESAMMSRVPIRPRIFDVGPAACCLYSTNPPYLGMVRSGSPIAEAHLNAKASIEAPCGLGREAATRGARGRPAGAASAVRREQGE